MLISVANLAITSPGSGNFTVAHGITRPIYSVLVQMDSAGLIWLQNSPPFDSANIYMTASSPGLTANAVILYQVV